MPLRQREWEIIPLARERLGLGKALGRSILARKDLLDKKLGAILREIYGAPAFIGAFGLGVVAFRGVGYLVRPPLIFGTVRIDPFKHTDLTHLQVQIIHSNHDLYESCIFQIGDAFDCMSGIGNFLTLHSSSKNTHFNQAYQLATEARRNFVAACTLASTGLDARECVLSAFLAIELSVKAVLASNGWDEKKLVKLSHKPDDFLIALKSELEMLDWPRVESVLTSAPNFVNVRYGKEALDERQSLDFVISTQYVVAELMRPHCSSQLLQSLGDEFSRKFPLARSKED